MTPPSPPSASPAASPDARRIRQACRDRCGKPALLVRAPGRVNLIGEHTDFNLGFVLPAAVDRALWLALRPRSDRRFRFYAADLDQAWEGGLERLERSPLGWPDYLLGVLADLGRELPAPGGVDCVFGGDVPIGSGLSSSAALTSGFAFGLCRLFGLERDRLDLARTGQRVENAFVGVNCGIMDPFASLFGLEGHLIRLDCRDLTHVYIPFREPGLVLVLCDSRVRRSLATGGEYNLRRAQCEEGVRVLAARHPEVASLRDVTLDLLEAHRAEMEPVAFRRCAYVVRENQRVLDACADLERGDFAAFGRRMDESHAGLRDGYQVSCPELDALVAGARALPGVLGARMMGAGFGGCTLNLVREAALPEFRAGMAEVYRRDLHADPMLHVCRLTDGTRAWPGAAADPC